MAKGTFQPTCDYDNEIEAMTDLILELDNRCPFSAPIARRNWISNELKHIAGVYGDRWPRSIYGDCVIADLEDAEKRSAPVRS